MRTNKWDQYHPNSCGCLRARAQNLVDGFKSFDAHVWSSWPDKELTIVNDLFVDTIRRLRYGERRRRLYHSIRYQLGEVLRLIRDERRRRLQPTTTSL